VALFIDDVNMPAYDAFGTQMPIELLRQYADYKFIYDRELLIQKEIRDTTLVCAAAPPEGGRKVLSKRFTRHFHMLCLPQQWGDALEHIFSAIIGGFLKDFKGEVQLLGKSMVASSTEIYKRITNDLRPTPAKSHYTFNLRDVSKVFQGICMAKTQTMNRTDKMVKLWVHETCRVFHDRLTTEEDRRYFTELVTHFVNTEFRTEISHKDLFEDRQVLFGDFMKRGIAFEERHYDEIKDFASLSKAVLDYQAGYNADHNDKLDLVLFPQCLQHITRICRILRQPRGNALLVGVGGSGKQTLTKLASYISECNFATPEAKKKYEIKDFRENIKKAMMPAGIQGERYVFLINDNQITREAFLEDVNNLLNSGEIPNVWEPEDKEEIQNSLRDQAMKAGVENVNNYFVARMRDYLHIVLCLSPVGESFRKRIRMFPSLVNCCTIDWVDSWPEEALLSVSSRFLG